MGFMAEIWHISLAGFGTLKSVRVWQKSADTREGRGNFQPNLSAVITPGA